MHLKPKNTRVYFLLIAGLIVGLASCKNFKTKDAANDAKQVNTYIAGSIIQPQNTHLRLYSENLKDTVAINKDGQFLFELHLESPQYVQIISQQKSINAFVRPGDSIVVVINDADPKQEIKLNGKGVNETQYLSSKYNLMMDMAIPLEHLYDYPPKRFKYIVDSTYIVHKINLDAFIEKSPESPASFIEKEKASILYERATKMYEYALANSLFNDNDAFFAFEKSISPNEAHLLDVYEYKTYLKALIKFKAKKQLNRQNNIHYTAQDLSLTQLQMANLNIENAVVKNYMNYTIVKQHVGYYGYKNIENIMQAFEQQCTNDSIKQIILTPYNKFKELSTQKSAPHFDFFDANDKSYTLDSFKGRYVYIDVWATWCLPCRKLAPFFAKLSKEYQHKNISFISLSIDKKQEDWMEYLKMKNKTEHQYIVKDIEAFVEDYQIKTIPHFLLINPEGRIINANAHRPDSKNNDWLHKIPNR